MQQTEEFKERQRKFSRYQREARLNPTVAELRVKAALDRLGVKYTFQKGFLRRRTLRLVDFYFPFCKVCLEVDGKYHEKQKDYDLYREKEVAKQRKGEVTFIRVTNEWVLAQCDLDAALLEKLSPHDVRFRNT